MKELVSLVGQGLAEDLVARDQWDRPLILPRTGHLDPCVPRTGKGGGCKCMVGYSRASSVGEALTDSFGLSRWQKGNMLKGIGERPDIVQAARVVQTNTELYELVELAELLGDNDVAARNGSTFHKLTERIDKGQDIPSGLPSALVAMCERYAEAMADFEVIDTEQFVVLDSLQIAGTYDKKIRLLKDKRCGGVVIPAGTVLIGDVKTGKSLSHMPLKVPAQIAVYDGSVYYDVGTHERAPLGVSKSHAKGLLIHAPWAERPEEAICDLRWVDLEHGRRVVKEAVKVREMRKIKPEQVMTRIS